VKYKLYFEDNLGYSKNVAFEKEYTVSEDKDAPWGDSNFDPLLMKSGQIVIGAIVADDESGVKNATLYYSTENSHNYSSVKMELMQGDMWNGEYLGCILPLRAGTGILNYYVIAHDNAGNEDEIFDDNFAVEFPAEIYLPETPPVHFDTRVVNVDIRNNMKAEVQIGVNGSTIVNETAYDENPYIDGISEDVSRFRNRDNFFEVPLKIELIQDPLYLFYNNPNQNATKLLSMLGYPSLFPFDKYYIHLFFAVNRKDAKITYDQSTLDSLKSAWDISSYAQTIDNNYLINEIGSKCLVPESAVLCPHANREDQTNGTTFLEVNFEIKRGYDIAAILIPLLAIFYLLGAIFVFESKPENTGNRLALSLGIFALTFTLSGIINSTKPVAPSPTIADTLLSTIVIAAIAYTISTVISGSSAIRKRFPKHHTWIDGIVFLFVSIIVIFYFASGLYPIEITAWLFPVIIFGLGYGLLMKSSEIRMSALKRYFFGSYQRSN
jgi:hypothetical protein